MDTTISPIEDMAPSAKMRMIPHSVAILTTEDGFGASLRSHVQDAYGFLPGAVTFPMVEVPSLLRDRRENDLSDGWIIFLANQSTRDARKIAVDRASPRSADRKGVVGDGDTGLAELKGTHVDLADSILVSIQNAPFAGKIPFAQEASHVVTLVNNRRSC